MMIIGVDYHPSDQYIAFADTETEKMGERRLWKITFLASRYRVRRIGICGNCSGIGIGWCRCAPGS